MAIDNKHPSYLAYIDDWEQMRDTYKGQRAVKAAGTKYLPATSGMVADGMNQSTQPGFKAYEAYKVRAVYHDFVNDAVKAAIGMLHAKPPVIELPTPMEPMLEKATVDGEGLEGLLRKINEAQLVTGRLGLLLDLPATPTIADVLPYIAMYPAESAINWDEGRGSGLTIANLNLVVLDETTKVRDRDFQWVDVKRYRVLVLGNPVANEAAGSPGLVYKVGVFEGDNQTFAEDKLLIPVMKGKSLDEIPFIFINSKDIATSPDDPPLLGLSNLALAVYRAEADYRQALFMQGQDTLVTIGVVGEDDKPLRLGAGGRINVPIGGDAKFIGVESSGLPEMRSALENDKSQAAQKGGQIVDTRSKEKESGDALRIRVAAQTATLTEIALAGAAGLQAILRMAARWMGQDPEKVTVTPNLDFVPEGMDGKSLVDLMTAKTLGAPISNQTIHEVMEERDLTNYTYEEELALIAEEEPLAGTGATEGPPEPEPDEDEDPNKEPAAE